MAALKATFSWTVSAAPTVVSQTLAITVNGTAQPPVSLGPTVATYVATVQEKDVIHAELWANDGFLDSAHAVVDATAPELVAPVAPTNLAVAFAPA